MKDKPTLETRQPCILSDCRTEGRSVRSCHDVRNESRHAALRIRCSGLLKPEPAVGSGRVGEPSVAGAAELFAVSSEAMHWRLHNFGLVPDKPGMLLARGFSELADDRGDLTEFTTQVESSIASARSRYGSTDEEIDGLLEWLVTESDLRRRSRAKTAVVATASKAGVVASVVAREFEAALARPAEADPGMLVLALADALDRTLVGIGGLLSHDEGVIA